LTRGLLLARKTRRFGFNDFGDSWVVVGKICSWVVVGKKALLPSFVSLLLALPVAFRPRRIVLAQLLPVARMLCAPLLRALQAPLPIHRVGGDLAPMVVTTAPSLAGRITASGLSRLKLRWLK
jgi:hypothetical protein